ncbi:aromatic amino acid hydroxylase [Psychroserpens sp.]|uniref:aromatic amino acid hydroxylase n=1 Tax=Psychroserpens sp. TaxID=2020870 RepID=UPI001B18EE81|nr:aromatic amino acid hydroxylase [Psychroserpens sp.]MBO6607965.1 aromatic amino acid hydroxylase [Psychroserpens sp.]MBO6654908.1 aromatic amino acid hydroxylase [Psychroserpens sp.]MBO6683018.1 aromatic amino acid hydroxylase [Psychroserpens sp.]MBO6751323.1 aromatic amino acid hydroxylase [Psychroserpens sp.]MBO6916506.1 aromatic amino acid hydroxylase [Psychroserpens sp.]
MQTPIESNPLIDRLPPHLKQFIKPQNYEDYSPIDQAVWRYVMRKNVSYLSKVAHNSYVKGLEMTGISIDDIPSMYGMNRILKDIGWAAVAVDGFIPPNAFMEFQAYKVLVIASDIRQLENIEYTPAPDIIHEAAGHAPIIANPDYAEYLRRFGEIGAKAILSSHDNDMYEAVRTLSILKEAADSTPEAIENAETLVHELQQKKVPLSEMAKIRNLHWWTVEYGLIGTIDDPKIYGAGLLSSIGESEWCMTNDVEKQDYSIDAADIEFDITQPQPQLFVTPDFAYLMQVLEEFANTMALRKGGFRGLRKLIDSKKIGSIELNTGLQISGVFTEMITDEDNNVVFFKTEGPTALANREKELIGHGTEGNQNGFCSPIGKLKGISLAIEDMGPLDLKAYNFYDGKYIAITYESGITVEGLNVTGIRNVFGKLILIEFEDCTVKYKDRILFSPEQGTFKLAVGSSIVSAFAGAADFRSFDNLYHVSETKTIQQKKNHLKAELEDLYAQVRNMRSDSFNGQLGQEIFETLMTNHSEDWLLSLELYELCVLEQHALREEVLAHLNALKLSRPAIAHLIDDGLALIKN